MGTRSRGLSQRALRSKVKCATVPWFPLRPTSTGILVERGPGVGVPDAGALARVGLHADALADPDSFLVSAWVLQAFILSCCAVAVLLGWMPAA